jgi:hypothetical protein
MENKSTPLCGLPVLLLGREQALLKRHWADVAQCCVQSFVILEGERTGQGVFQANGHRCVLNSNHLILGAPLYQQAENKSLLRGVVKISPHGDPQTLSLA